MNYAWLRGKRKLDYKPEQAVKMTDIHWLAGLLEGEGCFGLSKGKRSISITFAGTDLDVHHKVKRILCARSTLKAQRQLNKTGMAYRKQVYQTILANYRTAGWMMTLYPLLGERRRTRIRECLTAWKSWPANYKGRPTQCHPDRPHHGHGMCLSCYLVYRANKRKLGAQCR